MHKMFITGGLAVVLTSLVLANGALAETPAKTPPGPVVKPEARKLTTQVKTWTGDFDVMLERRVIRVLAPYSRSLYFNDKGRERGLTADSVRGFEQWINKKYKKQLGKRPITVLIIPTTRDRLLRRSYRERRHRGREPHHHRRTAEDRGLRLAPGSDVGEGSGRNRAEIPGDRSGGRPGRQDGPRAQGVELLREPRGDERAVAKEGKPAMKLVLVPDALEDEDMMEMLNAGLLTAIVVDDWKAKMWAQILPKIKVNEQAVVRVGGQIGWATRKGSPKLEAEILAYMKASLTKGVITGRVKQYMGKVKQIKDSSGRTS